MQGVKATLATVLKDAEGEVLELDSLDQLRTKAPVKKNVKEDKGDSDPPEKRTGISQNSQDCLALVSSEHAMLKLRIKFMERHQHHNQTM
ncbi:hypothetical protein PR048_004774 [Dryococelus australis]|uniref:Uncharacterized protein n=1 Tax=Dryococelus australis TaxID=614101 RepID=A0ABQ9I7G5_9NEOP|nr:hypothetical protein PR048_004774 [Dryococelus australis]